MNSTKNRGMALVAGLGAAAVPIGGMAAMLIAAPAANASPRAALVDGTYDGSLETVAEVFPGRTETYGQLKVQVTVAGGSISNITWPVAPTAAAAQAKVAAANAKVASATASISGGNAAVASGNARVSAGSAQVAAGSRAVATANKAVATAKKAVTKAKKTKKDKKDDKKAAAALAKANASLAAANGTVAAGNAAMASGRAAAASGQAAVAAGNAALASGNAELVSATAEFDFHSSSQTLNEIFLPMYADEAITAQSSTIASITGASASGVAFSKSMQAALTAAGM